MNGTMQIDSKPGVGTTVYLTLPFAVAEETTPAPCCCLRGMHILLAEDDALNREIAALLLRETGALVTEAADGRAVPILAMTASAFEEDRQRSLAAGINAHLPKPLDLQTLTDTLQTLPHRGPHRRRPGGITPK